MQRMAQRAQSNKRFAVLCGLCAVLCIFAVKPLRHLDVAHFRRLRHVGRFLDATATARRSLSRYEIGGAGTAHNRSPPSPQNAARRPLTAHPSSPHWIEHSARHTDFRSCAHSAPSMVSARPAALDPARRWRSRRSSLIFSDLPRRACRRRERDRHRRRAWRPRGSYSRWVSRCNWRSSGRCWPVGLAARSRRPC